MASASGPQDWDRAGVTALGSECELRLGICFWFRLFNVVPETTARFSRINNRSRSQSPPCGCAHTSVTRQAREHSCPRRRPETAGPVAWYPGAERDKGSMTLGQGDPHRDDIEIERQLRFLTSVSDQLSASDDWSSALVHVARTITEELADSCVIEILGESGPQQVAVADVDPRREALLGAVLPRTGPASAADGPRRRALNSREPLVLNDIDAAYWARVAFDDEHRAQLESLEIRSIVAVPMAARGRLIGIMTMGRATGRFEPGDVAVARDLAARIGLAIDNARLRTAAE